MIVNQGQEEEGDVSHPLTQHPEPGPIRLPGVPTPRAGGGEPLKFCGHHLHQLGKEALVTVPRSGRERRRGNLDTDSGI